MTISLAFNPVEGSEIGFRFLRVSSPRLYLLLLRHSPSPTKGGVEPRSNCTITITTISTNGTSADCSLGKRCDAVHYILFAAGSVLLALVFLCLAAYKRRGRHPCSACEINESAPSTANAPLEATTSEDEAPTGATAIACAIARPLPRPALL